MCAAGTPTAAGRAHNTSKPPRSTSPRPDLSDAAVKKVIETAKSRELAPFDALLVALGRDLPHALARDAGRCPETAGQPHQTALVRYAGKSTRAEARGCVVSRQCYPRSCRGALIRSGLTYVSPTGAAHALPTCASARQEQTRARHSPLP